MSCCISNVFCVIPLNRQWFSTKKNPNQELLSSKHYASSSNWMKGISDETLMSELNIPGTHDTMAVQSFFGLSIAICQRWSLTDQLLSGVRFLDIRVQEDNYGKMPIFHDIVFQKSYLQADVIEVCKEFLVSHPSETIILMLSIEHTQKKGQPLGVGFDRIVESKRDLFVFNEEIPNLGKLRGKIWLWPGKNWSYPGFSVNKSLANKTLIRQDFFELSVREKKEAVRATHNHAVNQDHHRKSGGAMFLNQLNVYKWYKWPSSSANSVNKYVHTHNLVFGVVALDFPGEGLLKQIIESNFTILQFPQSNQPMQSSLSTHCTVNEDQKLQAITQGNNLVKQLDLARQQKQENSG